MFKRHLLVAALGFAALLTSLAPASADYVRACAPDRSGAATGPARVTVPSSSSYSLDGQGCAIIAGTDRGWFSSQGYTFDPGFGSLQLRDITATPATLLLPRGAVIDKVIAQETSGSGLTGGWRIGTQPGGGQVLSLGVLPASSIRTAITSPIQTHAFSTTAAQIMYFEPHGNVNLLNSNVNLTIIYSYF